MASHVGMYLGSNSLQRPRSTARVSHILAFTTPHAKEGSPRRQTNRWFAVSGWVLRTTPLSGEHDPPIGCSLSETRQRVDNLNHPSWVLVIHPLFLRMSYSPIPTLIIALESQYILRVYTSFLPGA